MARGRWTLRAGMARERLGHAATPLLVVRVVEGLVAWLLFNEFFLPAFPIAWLVPAAFVTYFVLNLLVALRYRAGRLSSRLVLADLGVNVFPLMVPVAASGGLASPLLLLFMLKAITYGVVFSARMAAASLLATGVMLAAIVGADRAGILPVVPLTALPAATVHTATQAVILSLLVVGPLAVVWLRRLAAEADARRDEPPPGDWADREGAPAAVANALLLVSEAISRLTRLDEILEKVVEVAPRSLAVDDCSIALWAEDTGTYTAAAAASARPLDPTAAGSPLVRDNVADFEWARRLGHCAVVPASETPQGTLEVPGVLIAPLVSGERFYGVMQFARRGSGRTFTQRDLTIADGIARQTAVALDRARLVEESHRMVRALESTGEAVLITDAQRRVIFANPAFLRIFGFRPEEVIGRDAVEMAGDGAEWIVDPRRELQRYARHGETVARLKDGTTIPILFDTSLIRDDEGRIQGAVAILEDISEQKSLQQQLQRADRLAAVGEMAAGIAHEINNALVAIFGQTERREWLNAGDAREALARVDRQGRRIAEIVQGVLGFAAPRPPRREAVDLAAIATETLALIRHDLERQRVTLETAYHPDRPAALADPQQVQQVLLNLFSNALQAMAGCEHPWLRVAVLAIDDRLAVQVSDRGPGIPGFVLPRVFDPFFSTKAKGTGLGLSVSYAIARAHGGDLAVASDVGRGTTFTLHLPIAPPQEQELVRRVLLVDDDPEVAEALTEMLVREGLQVQRVASGRAALQALASGAWDGVFLDVRLPDLPGPDVFAELSRSRPDLTRKVVFVTGGLWRSESRLRQQLPPQPTLGKPCTQEQVREVLRWLRSHQEAA